MSLPPNPFTSSTIPSMKKSRLSSSSEKKTSNRMQIENVDRISNLPDDLLLKILKSMTTEKAIQTSLLSKRWEGVWKQIPYLLFDTRKALEVGVPLAEHSNFIAPLITKVINNHNGNLELCKIQHFSNQILDGTLETWVRSLIHVKHTKCLALERVHGFSREGLVLHLTPNIFSHPTLTSLLVTGFIFDFSHAFNNCKNLNILKLYQIKVKVDVLNTVIASCPSLKMLVLKVYWYRRIGCLKIHNNNLKVVHLSCNAIDNIEVSAALLDIFSIHDIELASGTKIVLDAPRLLRFSQIWGDVDQSMPHIIYNISCDAQGNENIGHEFVRNIENYDVIKFATLAVNVDMMNPKEVRILKEVLDAWARDLQKLQILFKDNDVYKKEGESSIDRIQKKRRYRFLSVDLCVKNVCMYNFNGLDEDQFALAASFVRQGKMMESLTIETSSLSANKKLAIDIAVAKLKKLRKGNKKLSIEYI